MEQENLLNNKIETDNKTISDKTIDNKTIYDKTINILYNKKWLIIIGILIILCIIYIYYSDIPLNIPFTIPCIKLNKKKDNQTYDEITEFNDNTDEWILEDEINNYMNLQDEYINNLN